MKSWETFSGFFYWKEFFNRFQQAVFLKTNQYI